MGLLVSGASHIYTFTQQFHAHHHCYGCFSSAAGFFFHTAAICVYVSCTSMSIYTHVSLARPERNEKMSVIENFDIATKNDGY